MRAHQEVAPWVRVSEGAHERNRRGTVSLDPSMLADQDFRMSPTAVQDEISDMLMMGSMQLMGSALLPDPVGDYSSASIESYMLGGMTEQEESER